jgi:glycosyltransferase involved in cell wall biosynthesis
VILTNYNLKLIGDGDITSELKVLTQKLNLESRVEFVGYLNPIDISKELEISSIGLNMLIPESDNYKLSLANKFFDYMHAGLPSVNMKFQEYMNINSEHEVSILVNNYTTKDLIQAVRSLEIDKNYKRIQQNCIEAKLLFNWENESNKLIDIFNSVTAV